MKMDKVILLILNVLEASSFDFEEGQVMLQTDTLRPKEREIKNHNIKFLACEIIFYLR
jgi:hypothetical protein